MVHARHGVHHAHALCSRSPAWRLPPRWTQTGRAATPNSLPAAHSPTADRTAAAPAQPWRRALDVASLVRNRRARAGGRCCFGRRRSGSGEGGQQATSFGEPCAAFGRRCWCWCCPPRARRVPAVAAAAALCMRSTLPTLLLHPGPLAAPGPHLRHCALKQLLLPGTRALPLPLPLPLPRPLSPPSASAAASTLDPLPCVAAPLECRTPRPVHPPSELPPHLSRPRHPRPRPITTATAVPARLPAFSCPRPRSPSPPPPPSQSRWTGPPAATPPTR